MQTLIVSEVWQKEENHWWHTDLCTDRMYIHTHTYIYIYMYCIQDPTICYTCICIHIQYSTYTPMYYSILCIYIYIHISLYHIGYILTCFCYACDVDARNMELRVWWKTRSHHFVGCERSCVGTTADTRESRVGNIWNMFR